MKVKLLEVARKEALRFLNVSDPTKPWALDSNMETFVGGRRVAAVKRASLDLTMALAKLRREPF